MSKNEKVTENKEQTEQKVMTKYDRKVQKRKEEKEKEKKEERISTAIGIVVLVALVCLVASFPIRTYLATHETYVVVNGEAVNKVEFDYQYNLTKNNYITQYGSYLTYFGLDTSKDLSTQMYSDTLTWQDYFEQNAVESLKQNKALMAEAKAAGFTYDTTDEYNTFKETIKTSAASAGISEKEYVRSIYGSYATMGRIEEYVKNDMVMNAYYQKLQEDNAPSDDEIQSYYEENKATYDSVDYRLTTIEALVAQIEENSAGRVQAYSDKLYARLQELLGDRSIDEGRLVTEAAIFADKTAIDEETVRLHSHVAQYREILELDEPIGRKLDFLTQELNRESNTIGSKCQDVAITRLVVELKSEIEKIREQIQNIE